MGSTLFLVLWFLFSTEAVSTPMLISGRPVERDEFPEVVYITNGASLCSATLIGSRTVLTAAHCVKNNAHIIPAKIIVHQNLFKGKCLQHPLYGSDFSYDYALCYIDKELVVERYGIIASTHPPVGGHLTLSGYGCLSSDPLNGGNDGILRIGDAQIVGVPNIFPGDNTQNGQYISTSGGAALCFGDSGGPAFLQLDNTSDDHFIVGVNSRGDIRSLSFLSSTASGEFHQWARTWAEHHHTSICGIDIECFQQKEVEHVSCWSGICGR